MITPCCYIPGCTLSFFLTTHPLFSCVCSILALLHSPAGEHRCILCPAGNKHQNSPCFVFFKHCPSCILLVLVLARFIFLGDLFFLFFVSIDI